MARSADLCACGGRARGVQEKNNAPDGRVARGGPAVGPQAHGDELCSHFDSKLVPIPAKILV